MRGYYCASFRRRTSVRRKRPAPASFLNSSINSGSRGISRSRKELTADDHKPLRIPKWRPVLPLTLWRKDRLELFFERRGHGQVFDDHVVQGGSDFGDELRNPSAFSGKLLPPRTRAPVARLAVSHNDARSYPGSRGVSLIAMQSRPLGVVFISNDCS
jgi:hypothetical protein